MDEMEETYEILHGERAVWVNDDTGCCIGRFGVMGIDIHHTGATQIAHTEPSQCLQCTHTKTTLEDWETFKDGMLRHHGVDMSGEEPPLWLGQAPSPRRW